MFFKARLKPTYLYSKQPKEAFTGLVQYPSNTQHPKSICFSILKYS